MFDKILVGLDGSQNSAPALETAIGLAQRCQARLVLFHAIDVHPARAHLEHFVEEAARAVYQRAGQEIAGNILDDAERRAREAGLAQVERVVEEGSAARTIVDYAKRNGVELIVIGTRGLMGLHGLALGSVAQQVTATAHCPVMVVR
jgi:nucleotide-binding universal stress UspA family protein